MDSLVSYAQERKLLPNLQHFTFDCVILEKHPSLLTLFLSPNLLHIEVTDTRSSTALDIDDATRLLDDIALSCAVLQKLDLVTFLDKSFGRFSKLIPVPDLKLFHHLGAVQNLRMLRTNITIFQPFALEVVGSLPHLETLWICDVKSSRQIPTSTLPSHAFPALQKLCLMFLSLDALKVIWDIQHFATRPTILRVLFWRLKSENEVAALLSDICQHCPQIIDLTFDFMFDYEADTQNLSSDSLRPLQHLSLQKLSISGINVASLDATCKTLSEICPQLRELRLYDRSISVADLRHFARLSRLELLYVSVDWQSCLELNESASVPLFVSTAFRQLYQLRFLYESSEPTLITKTVQYVLLYFNNWDLNL